MPNTAHGARQSGPWPSQPEPFLSHRVHEPGECPKEQEVKYRQFFPGSSRATQSGAGEENLIFPVPLQNKRI